MLCNRRKCIIYIIPKRFSSKNLVVNLNRLVEIWDFLAIWGLSVLEYPASHFIESHHFLGFGLDLIKEAPYSFQYMSVF